jgi:cytochrome c
MARVLAALAILASMVWATTLTAGEQGTREEAVAMVKRVQAKFERDGADATFKAILDQANEDFHDRDLYPFVYNMQGVIVATGSGRTALVGKSLLTLRDQDGKYLVQEMLDIAKGPGSGWINYKWPNPATKRVESKSSYIEKMGDYVVGVGIWTP